MKKALIILFIFSITNVLLAQEKITATVQHGDDVNTILSSSRFLLYDFKELTLNTPQGTGKVLMNYNMLTDEMMFINSSGDTVALANPAEVKSIRFGKRTFIYTPNGYMEILIESKAEPKALLVSHRIKPETVKHYGAYGRASNVASIKSVSSITDDVSVGGRLSVNSEVTYAVTLTYYLQSGNKYYAGTTEKNFQKLFGKENKDTIHTYIEENKLDLKNEANLIQLFNYCIENF